jgi:predicted transcriptional regulator
VVHKATIFVDPAGSHLNSSRHKSPVRMITNSNHTCIADRTLLYARDGLQHLKILKRNDEGYMYTSEASKKFDQIHAETEALTESICKLIRTDPEFMVGKNPLAVAASIVYMAVVLTKDPVSMKMVAEAFKVWYGTVGKHAHFLGKRFDKEIKLLRSGPSFTQREADLRHIFNSNQNKERWRWSKHLSFD